MSAAIKAKAKKKKAKKDQAGSTDGKTKGAAANKTNKNPKKRKLSMEEAEAEFIANAPPGREDHYKLFAKKEIEKAEKKRVHSKAYHAALTLAKHEGKSPDAAKALARKAGTDAVKAWSENIKG